MRSKNAFWCSIPSSRDVFCVRARRRRFFDESKIRNFHFLFDAIYKDVLWLEISVEKPIFMHVSDCSNKLMHYIRNFYFFKRLLPYMPFSHKMCQIFVKQLKNYEHYVTLSNDFFELDNVGMHELY